MHSVATPLEILTKNTELRDDSRVQCKYFGSCGGCQYQVRWYRGIPSFPIIFLLVNCNPYYSSLDVIRRNAVEPEEGCHRPSVQNIFEYVEVPMSPALAITEKPSLQA